MTIPHLHLLQASLTDPVSHKYCLKSGTMPLLQAAVDWFDRTCGVKLNPETQALSLVGSQEGLAHLLMAVADPGDGIFMTDVAYPSYFGAGEGFASVCLFCMRRYLAVWCMRRQGCRVDLPHAAVPASFAEL
jgi:aspartate/methionine/tyrosine aminotransferase